VAGAIEEVLEAGTVEALEVKFEGTIEGIVERFAELDGAMEVKTTKEIGGMEEIEGNGAV